MSEKQKLCNGPYEYNIKAIGRGNMRELYYTVETLAGNYWMKYY